MNSIKINGITMSMIGDEIRICGIKAGGQKEVKIDKGGNIQGDVTGDIKVTGDNVTLIINGDLTGNIEGNCKVKVAGDFTGNIQKGMFE